MKKENSFVFNCHSMASEAKEFDLYSRSGMKKENNGHFKIKSKKVRFSYHNFLDEGGDDFGGIEETHLFRKKENLCLSLKRSANMLIEKHMRLPRGRQKNILLTIGIKCGEKIIEDTLEIQSLWLTKGVLKTSFIKAELNRLIDLLFLKIVDAEKIDEIYLWETEKEEE